MSLKKFITVLVLLTLTGCSEQVGDSLPVGLTQQITGNWSCGPGLLQLSTGGEYSISVGGKVAEQGRFTVEPPAAGDHVAVIQYGRESRHYLTRLRKVVGVDMYRILLTENSASNPTDCVRDRSRPL